MNDRDLNDRLSRQRTGRVGIVLACLCTWVVAGAGFARGDDGDGPVFVAEQPSGVVSAEGYTKLEVLQLAGAVSVRAGLPGDLRFMCRDLKTRREERPVALWTEGKSMILGPAEGAEAERVLCEAVVPPNLDVVIEVESAKVEINGIETSVEVVGEQVDVQARSMKGSFEVELVGGRVRVFGAENDVEVKGKDVDVTVNGMEGFLKLDLEGGTTRLTALKGEFSGDLEGTKLIGEDIDGLCEISAEGGSVALSSIENGATLVLTALVLSKSKGALEIETDTSAEIREMGGDLRMRASGGPIAALGSSASVHIDASECEVTVEGIAGKTTLLGDQLSLQLRDLKGDLSVTTTGTQVVVAGVEGTVAVQNDFGDVVIAKALQSVTITNQEGNVRVTQLAGPLQLKTSGPDVTVHWIDSSHGKDSLVENSSGNVTVMFSANGGGRLDARSLRGEIGGSLPGVDVAEDGRSAQGTINRLTRPTITVVADGNLTLNSGPRSEVKPAAGSPRGAQPANDGKKR